MPARPPTRTLGLLRTNALLLTTMPPRPCVQVTGCERRIVQLQHEMKRKEKEYERLQERWVRCRRRERARRGRGSEAGADSRMPGAERCVAGLHGGAAKRSQRRAQRRARGQGRDVALVNSRSDSSACRHRRVLPLSPCSLSHYLSDKRKNDKAVLDMAGKLTQQLAGGGAAVRASAAVRSDEGLKAVVAAYETKQAELGRENRDLKAALASLQVGQLAALPDAAGAPLGVSVVERGPRARHRRRSEELRSASTHVPSQAWVPCAGHAGTICCPPWSQGTLLSPAWRAGRVQGGAQPAGAAAAGACGQRACSHGVCCGRGIPTE